MSNLTPYRKDYLSEKASRARLKNDIIKQSRLIKPSKSQNNLSYKKSKKFIGLLLLLAKELIKSINSRTKYSEIL